MMVSGTLVTARLPSHSHSLSALFMVRINRAANIDGAHW